ncbi:MAG: hypothetical protein LBH01_04000 [Verrucomicrobiales bacterium]|jgi:hypothetical protein|nr:hypothetical protein [Verrucomicrobiales bacterium]
MPLVRNPDRNRRPDTAESFDGDDFELPVNPEIERKIADFKKEHPRLAVFVKTLPRERLENAYVLQHVERSERFEIYKQKAIAAMDKPENAELKKQIEEKLANVLDPRVRERLFGRKVMQAVAIGSLKI